MDRNVAERLLVEELRKRGWPATTAVGVMEPDSEQGTYEVFVRLGTHPERYAAGRVENGVLQDWRMVKEVPLVLMERGAPPPENGQEGTQQAAGGP